MGSALNDATIGAEMSGEAAEPLGDVTSGSLLLADNVRLTTCEAQSGGSNPGAFRQEGGMKG